MQQRNHNSHAKCSGVVPDVDLIKNISLEKESANSAYFATDHLLADLKGRTVSSGVVTGLSQAIQFLVNISYTMVIARLLTPEDFGIVAMVTVAMGFLRVFKDAGLSTATVQREDITQAQVSNLFWLNVAICVTLSILFAAGAPLIARFYHEPRAIWIAIILSLTFILEGSTIQHLALLNRQMQFGRIALVELGSMTLGCIAGIIMAKFGYGFWALVSASITSALARFLLTWFISDWRPNLPKRNSGIRPLVSFGANLTFGSFVYSLARGTDGLLVGRYCGAEAFGLYGRAAALLIRPVEQFMSPFNTVIVPVLSRVQSQPDRYRRLFLQVYEAVALVSFFVTGFLLALSKPLTLVILGPRWIEASPIFAAFTVAALFYPLTTAATWLFASQGRGRDWMFTSAFVSFVSVGAFLVGLPFGPTGVALSYSLSGVFIQLPFLYFVAGRRGPVPASDLWLGFFRHLPISGVVCAITWGIRNGMSTFPPLVQILVSCPIGLLGGSLYVWWFPPSRRVAMNIIQLIRRKQISP